MAFHRALKLTQEIEELIATEYPDIDLYQETTAILSNPLPFDETMYTNQTLH